MAPEVSPAVRVVGRGLAAAGALALGAALGAIAERSLLRGGAADDDGVDDLGAFRGRAVTVTTTDGVDLYVEIDDPADDGTPDADGLTVVFCHGYALSMDSWHFQRHSLHGLARCVYYDQRSHGRSGRGEFDSHHIDQLGADLGEVIDAVAPAGPLLLVGHSMGGMTVMSLAAQRPELFADRVFGVALIATSAGQIDSGDFGLPRGLGVAMHRIGPALAAALARRKTLVERTGWDSSDLGLALTRRYSFGSTGTDREGRFVASMVSATPMDVVADFLPALQEHDKREALAALEEAELLVLVGDNDRLTPRRFSDEIVRRLPGAEYVVVPDAGHMVMIEKHDEVDVHLRALLARVRRDIAADPDFRPA